MEQCEAGPWKRGQELYEAARISESSRDGSRRRFDSHPEKVHQSVYVQHVNDRRSGAIDNRVDLNRSMGDIQTADNSQMTYCREDIYRYFGLSDKMITGTFTESDSNAFYESLIEPLSIQLSQEFTAKVFTSRAQGFRKWDCVQTNRLEYADAKSEAQPCQVLQQSASSRSMKPAVYLGLIRSKMGIRLCSWL